MRDRDLLLEQAAEHCDLRDRLALVPPGARLRGMFFHNIERVLEQADPALHTRFVQMFPERQRTMLWYPAHDFLTRLVAAGALLRGPEHVHQGMSDIGRRNAVAFAESLIGRVMLRLLSKEPTKLLRQGVAAHRQTSSHGDWALEITGDRSATMHMRDEYMYIESHYVGAAQGTFDGIGLTVQVEVHLTDRFNGQHRLTW